MWYVPSGFKLTGRNLVSSKIITAPECQEGDKGVKKAQVFLKNQPSDNLSCAVDAYVVLEAQH